MSAIVAAKFGAAVDRLENTVGACPEALWSDPEWCPQFWRLALVYLTGSLAGFVAPPPFTPSVRYLGTSPERVYSKEELHGIRGTAAQKSRRKWVHVQAKRPAGFGNFRAYRR